MIEVGYVRVYFSTWDICPAAAAAAAAAAESTVLAAAVVAVAEACWWFCLFLLRAVVLRGAVYQVVDFWGFPTSVGVVFGAFFYSFFCYNCFCSAYCGLVCATRAMRTAAFRFSEHKTDRRSTQQQQQEQQK